MSNHAAVAGEAGRIFSFLREEFKPRGPWLTPFNIISIPIMLTGVVILVYRFIYGLGYVTNLSQEHPWGLWLGFDVVTGVALAGGAYVITFTVYVMRVEKYHSIVRATVLNGFLAYCFYGGALLFDIGRPWNAMNPFIGNNFGYASVLFLICWHFALYMVAAFIEFSPVIAEWLNMEKARRFLKNLTLGTVDTFTYFANDGTVDSAEATATITFDGINDAPTIDTASGSTQTENLASAGDTVATFVASDLEGDAITYSITSGNDDGYFELLNPNSGVVTLTAAGEAALAKFRTWVEKRYDGDFAKLKAAWGNPPFASFAEATPMQEKDLPVTYVLFPDEGHGFRRPQNRTAFYAVAELFLAHCLGGEAQSVGADLRGSSAQVPVGATVVPGLAEALDGFEPTVKK